MAGTRPPHASQLGSLPALDVTSLEGLSDQQKHPTIAATSPICRKLMQDLGVKWKPQPVDPSLRRRTIDWIKSDLEAQVGPVDKRFLLGADAGLTYVERVYEDGDFETKASVVKYVTIAIYLDDLIDRDVGMAKKAESFLAEMLGGGLGLLESSNNTHTVWLEQYRGASVELASHISDPLARNMLLHSCTLFIEGCALEYHVQKDPGRYFLVTDVEMERKRDDMELKLATDLGYEIPLPLDGDRLVDISNRNPDYLAPHGWPMWLRERSAVTETFAITSFRAPAGVDIPTWIWLTSLSEMRTMLLSINDVLSFAKELLVDDATSSIAVLTKERRLIGMPGTAPDDGWCLRDTFDEVLVKIHVAGARVNRLLRPRTTVRYTDDGRVREVSELVGMLRGASAANLESEEVDSSGSGLEGDEECDREEILKALALKLWETHQRGYVAWHFQCARYRTYELFDWVGEMVGSDFDGPEWLTSYFVT